jgi:hypothetical protein
MTTSARIQECIMDFLSDRKQHSVQEIKSHLAEINLGEYSEGQFSGSINTLQRNGKVNKIDRGVYIMRYNEEGSENMKTCFVVSPIGDTGSEIRNNADKLLRHIIKPACESRGFEAIRVDQLNDTNSITQTIIEKLEMADLVIADITGHNPNVFYEIGFRTRTNKPIIYLKEQGENLPFDVNTIRTFDYNLTDLDSVEEVRHRLDQTIKSMTFPSSSDYQNSNEDNIHENTTASILPILYQIIDAVTDLQNEIKNNNNDIIRTVIKTMQNTQPQISPETALQTQLLGSFIQNPESLMKLAEIVDKFPSQQGGGKLKP